MIRSHPVDTRDDVKETAATRARQHAHGHDRDSFRDTIRLTTHGARHVRAMTVAVFRATTIVDAGVTCHNASAELAVIAAHTSVDYVGAHT